MIDFDVILGMNWLSSYHAIIDCYAKTVTLACVGLPKLVWSSAPSSYPKIFYVHAHGCLSYLAHVRDNSKELSSFETTRVVREVIDLFPTDLPVIPPERDIDFAIDVEPGSKPIFISPYRMAPAELKKLKEQLEDPLEKWFIRPSVSP